VILLTAKRSENGCNRCLSNLAGRITIDQSFISATVIQETPEYSIFRIPQLEQCMKFRHFDKNSQKPAKSSRTTLTQPVCGRAMLHRVITHETTVISLHGELRALREGICNSCQRKFVPANLVSESSRAAKPQPASTVSSLVRSSQGQPKHTNPTFSWRRLLKTHAFGHIPSSSGPPIPGSQRTYLKFYYLGPPFYLHQAKLSRRNLYPEFLAGLPNEIRPPIKHLM